MLSALLVEVEDGGWRFGIGSSEVCSSSELLPLSFIALLGGEGRFVAETLRVPRLSGLFRGPGCYVEFIFPDGVSP
jgi:hypothetical protein